MVSTANPTLSFDKPLGQKSFRNAQQARLSMIRNLILVVLAVTASALLPSLGFSQTGETSLRWQFPVGRKMEIEMTQRMKNSQNMTGNETSTAMTTTNFMTWEVDSFDESSGVATVKSEIDRMTMNMNSPNGEFKVDSDSDKELEGMAKVVGGKLIAMVGKPFVQTMDARGEVLTVEFPKEFDQAAMVIGKDAMEKLIKNASPMFPKDPISVGHSWTQQTTTPMPGGLGAMQLESTYTYKGSETIESKKLEVIDIDMNVSFTTPEGSPGSVEITDQSTDGKMYFDAANGHTTSMKVQQSMTMAITFSGQRINQTIENTTEGKFILAK